MQTQCDDLGLGIQKYAWPRAPDWDAIYMSSILQWIYLQFIIRFWDKTPRRKMCSGLKYEIRRRKGKRRCRDSWKGKRRVSNGIHDIIYFQKLLRGGNPQRITNWNIGLAYTRLCELDRNRPLSDYEHHCLQMTHILMFIFKLELPIYLHKQVKWTR